MRLDPETIEAALTKPGCEHMQHGGRTMKGFLFVHLDDHGEPTSLRKWVRLALEYNPQAPLSREKARRGTGSET